MNARHVTTRIGVAAGAVLGAAFLSAAVAFADSSTDSLTAVVDPSSPVTGTSATDTFGLPETQFANQIFNIDDTTVAANTTLDPHGLPDVVGQFTANQNDTSIFGILTNTYTTVTGDEATPTSDLSAAATGSSATEIIDPDFGASQDPAVGTISDVLTVGGLENVYVDSAGTIGDGLFYDGTEITDLSSLASTLDLGSFFSEL